MADILLPATSTLPPPPPHGEARDKVAAFIDLSSYHRERDGTYAPKQERIPLRNDDGDASIIRVYDTRARLFCSATDVVSEQGERIVYACDPSENALISTAARCFNEHRPLILCPDDLLLPLIHAAATHVTKNSGAYRHMFVGPQKQMQTIAVETSGEHSSQQEWAGVFSQFEARIANIVGNANAQLFKGHFSTTDTIKQACYSVALMDGMSCYFKYETFTLCGIPSITLKGTADDWKEMECRAIALLNAVFCKGIPAPLQWVDAMRGTLAQITATATQAQDAPHANNFWESIIKQRSLSGTVELDGWLLLFFPYVKDVRTKITTLGRSLANIQKRAPDTFSAGVRCVDVKHTDLRGARRVTNMVYTAGHVGIVQGAAPDYALRVAWGWLVTNE